MFKYKLIVGKEMFEQMYHEKDAEKKRKQSFLSLILLGTIFLWIFWGTSSKGTSGMLIATIGALIINNGLTVAIALYDKKAFLDAEDSESENSEIENPGSENSESESTVDNPEQ